MKSEYIRKHDAIDAIHCDIKITGRENAETVCKTIESFTDGIKSLEPADVVEVVRCRECKYWVPGYPTYYGDDFIVPECGIYKQMVGCSGDDFCSYGETKEEVEQREREE